MSCNTYAADRQFMIFQISHLKPNKGLRVRQGPLQTTAHRVSRDFFKKMRKMKGKKTPTDQITNKIILIFIQLILINKFIRQIKRSNKVKDIMAV